MFAFETPCLHLHVTNDFVTAETDSGLLLALALTIQHQLLNKLSLLLHKFLPAVVAMKKD